MRSKWCPHCRRQVLAVYQYPQFALHSLLVVATCGLYLPFWFIAVSRQRWNCPRCAGRV